ncbi:transcriptional regulator [Streptomyces wuyuanensis]|uniref:transcriptional regulator n=1 Tax=Streptomyces wuyuanensis TaxID=1196353 RepID=UPI0037116EB2
MTEQSHPRHRLDDVLLLPVRLSIVAMLDGVASAQFRAVRDTVEISDVMLSKQITVLENAGYLRIWKEPVGRRTRTWLALTEEGQGAFRGHMNALRDIANTTVVPPADGPQ